MPFPTCSDSEFIDLIKTQGISTTAKILGINVRAVYARRSRLEGKIGAQITSPNVRPTSTRFDISHPRWLEHEIKNGIVLVGSDAHFWPEIRTTAFRGFLKLAEEMKPSLIVMNGDVMDGASISRFQPIGWESRPTLIDEIEACQARLGEIEKAAGKARRIWTLGNHDCLDTQTECLTKRGWVKHSDIRGDDFILSLVEDEARWSPIDEVVSFPYSGELVRVEKTRVSVAVTPNHRVLLSRLNWRSKRYDIREYRRADDLPCSFDIPTAGRINNPGVDIPDDAIALTGWLLTDGGYDGKDISIYQSKLAGVEEIGNVLDRLGVAYSRYERQRERRAICGRALLKDPLRSYQFFILAESKSRVKQWLPRRGVLPEWAKDMNTRQFHILLNALVAGDGVWDGSDPSRKTCAVIYGMEPILSSIQEIAVCHGWRARLVVDNRGDHRLCLAKEPKIRVDRPEVFSEPYDGVVWCLRVPHGNFMVRRNGSTYFTGNSRYETKLATVAPEYAKVHGVHLQDHFPLWEPAWSVLINSNTVVKHRFKGGIHAPHNNTLWGGKTILTGHLHSMKVQPISDYNGTRWGVDTGTLADAYGMQFRDYTEESPVNWRSGFIVLTYENGELRWPEIAHAHAEGKIDFRGRTICV